MDEFVRIPEGKPSSGSWCETTVPPDPWLEPWLPLLADHSGDAPILELGCGTGLDTAVLTEAGHAVVAIDISAEAIEQAMRRAPTARFLCQDLRNDWPRHPEGFSFALSSLSLHYFPWAETLSLVERIHDALRPGGILLCRLNSINDHNHGASGYPQIAENFYQVNGKTKRFFDRDSLGALFGARWRTLAMEERVIHRYAQPKSVWELAVEARR
jgi:SAM-dependent methyltransferase